RHVHRTVTRAAQAEVFAELLDIMRQQEQWVPKLDEIVAFKITRGRANKALKLKLQKQDSRRWLTVSWRNGTQKKRKPANALASAFRSAIRRQITAWA